MIHDLLRQVREVPEYFIAFKAALAILASGLPIYAGLWYFLHRRHLKAHWAFTVNFVGAIVLLSGLAFLLASPLSGLLHPAIITAYLFVTCVVSAFSIVALLDLFLIRHYLSNVKKFYISPPLHTVIQVFIFCLAILPILHFVLHFNPLTLVAIPTIATAGLALALQDTLKTFIAGVSLGKILRIGEWIGFQDKEGRVVDINWARTVLRTNDGNFVFIPNSLLQTGVFMNYSTTNPTNRLCFKVGVSYGTSPAQVKRVLLQCASGVSGIAATPGPSVYLHSYDNSAITYGLYYWIDDYGRMLDVQDEVATRIWYAFRREGIEIPYPTRTLYMQRPSSDDKQDPEGIARALKQWTLAEAFHAEELHDVSQFTAHRTYARAETIMKQGDTGQSLFLILEGLVDVFEDENPQIPLAELKKGDIFGEMSLLTGEPRSATVRAKGPVEALEIQKAGLQKVMARRPEISDQLAQLVLDRQAVLAGRTQSGASSEEDKSAEARSLSSRIRKFFAL